MQKIVNLKKKRGSHIEDNKKSKLLGWPHQQWNECLWRAKRLCCHHLCQCDVQIRSVVIGRVFSRSAVECAANYRSGFKFISIGSGKMLSGLILSRAGGQSDTITSSSSIIVSWDVYMMSVVIGHISPRVLLNLQTIVFLWQKKDVIGVSFVRV